MQRPKFEVRAEINRNIEHSPKLAAKKVTNFRKKALIGQASAHCANRNPYRRPTPGKVDLPPQRVEYIYHQRQDISEEQIKNSAIFRLLEQEIREMTARQEIQIRKLQDMKAEKLKQTQAFRTEQHAVKLQIWELKNEAMELKEAILDEKQETQRLMDELGVESEEQEVNPQINGMERGEERDEERGEERGVSRSEHIQQHIYFGVGQ